MSAFTLPKNMDWKKDILPLLGKFGPWAGFVLVPILLNVLIWNVLVMPPRSESKKLREMQSFTRLRSELLSLVSESGERLEQWENTGLIKNSSTTAVEEIRRLAEEHGVNVASIDVSDKEDGGVDFGQVSVDLEVSGSYQKLAKWMNALESRPGFQMRRWFMTPSHEAGTGNFLSINLDVLLVRS